MFVDRLMGTPMHYPCNYGYILYTLFNDGDPTYLLVITLGRQSTAGCAGVLFFGREKSQVIDTQRICRYLSRKVAPWGLVNNRPFNVI